MSEMGVDYDAAVAVVGMSGRFPGADSVDRLWSNLMDGTSGIRRLTDEELTDAGVAPAQLANPAYVRTTASLEDIDLFDAGMFGFTRNEAELMDPQHRIFLECCWEVLENSGYQPTAMPGRVGVFAGCGHPDYQLHVGPRAMSEAGGALLMAVGNERDSLASLISYKLGLSGPSLTVQTFCSTSLVAVHLAAQSLLNFECEAAIAGGVFIPLPQNTGYLYEEGGILSPDGRVRSFDAGARGSVMGSGVSVVAIKRLSDAMEDGDHIEALILGSAVNNDGLARAGYTAPGVNGQAEVMEQALSFSGVRPESIGYVECHATGTQLGDSIELAALNRAYPRAPDRPVVLGSLKPVVGHLDRASGATGLIKTALALKNGVLPATPGYAEPNPTLAAERDRFTVLRQHAAWPDEGRPRRAGVSSFGLGGTNAHVIMEEPPRTDRVSSLPRDPRSRLLVLSARNESALGQAARNLARHLAEHPELDLGDVAFTLQRSRAQFPVRHAIVCDSQEEARAALADLEAPPTPAEPGHEPLAEITVPSGTPVPDTWWRELRQAALRLVGEPTEPEHGAGTGTEPALAVVTRVLRRLGCRMGAEGAAGTGGTAPRLVLEPDPGLSSERWLLETLGRIWAAGGAVDWTLTDRADAQRVELPGYPFQRRRYWVDMEEFPFGAGPADEGRTGDLSRWTYVPSWRRRENEPADCSEDVRTAGPWLVLADGEFGEALAEQIGRTGARTVVARPDSVPGGAEEQRLTFRPGDADDAHRLIGALPWTPRMVVHALAPDDADRPFGEQLHHGFETARMLVGALAAHAPAQPVDLLTVTSQATQFAGTAPHNPAQAAFAALLPVVAQENPGWVCRSVDVSYRPGSRPDRALIAAVLREAVTPWEGPVVLRGAERWVRTHEPLPLPVGPPAAEGPLQEGATVLLTGGLGHVGLILAEHLTLQHGCRVVLTARTELPERETWEKYLTDTGDVAESKTRRCVRKILELEKAGGQVLALAADVSDAAQMRTVVEQAEANFGSLDLVIHAAGVSDPAAFGPAHMVGPEECRNHFSAKTGGFRALEAALGDRDTPGITLSSLSAVLGGLALGPYAAANAALDACALAARNSGGRSWLTVNWDTWCPEVQDVGHTGEFDMSRQEATEVFDRAVAALGTVDHLVISTGPLEPRFAQWIVRRGSAVDTEPDDTVRDPRPALSTQYVAPDEGLERRLADIWAQVLRLEEVGADDGFFQLGGNSLMAIQLIAKVRADLGIPVPTTALLGYPTVRGLAGQITDAIAEDE